LIISRHEKVRPIWGAVLRSRPDYWPVGQGYDTPKIKLFSPSDMAQVLCVLKQRGWSDADLQAYLGKNFKRVAKQIWGA
jgi:membrane dipeptidase